jgi:hypothetical protein
MNINQIDNNETDICRRIHADRDTISTASPAKVPIISGGPNPANQTATAVMIPAAVNEDISLSRYAERINAHLTNGVAAWVEAGRELIAAKSKLAHGHFQGLFEPGVLRVDQRTAEMLMRIAENAVLSNSNNYSILPAALNTLHQLSRMPAPSLHRAIKNGKVTSTITIKQAKALVGAKKAVRPARVEPNAVAQTVSVVAVAPHVQTSAPVVPPAKQKSLPDGGIENIQELQHSLRDALFTLCGTDPNMARGFAACLRLLARQVEDRLPTTKPQSPINAPIQ